MGVYSVSASVRQWNMFTPCTKEYIGVEVKSGEYTCVPRRLFFAAQQRMPSPRSLISKDALFKKEKESARRTVRSHVTLEKSSKNYIRCENEPSQATIHSVPPPPPLRKLRRRIFHVVRENVQVAGAEATHHGDSPVGEGRVG